LAALGYLCVGVHVDRDEIVHVQKRSSGPSERLPLSEGRELSGGGDDVPVPGTSAELYSGPGDTRGDGWQHGSKPDVTWQEIGVRNDRFESGWPRRTGLGDVDLQRPAEHREAGRHAG
jgi:hypothetical protein